MEYGIIMREKIHNNWVCHVVIVIVFIRNSLEEKKTYSASKLATSFVFYLVSKLIKSMMICSSYSYTQGTGQTFIENNFFPSDLILFLLLLLLFLPLIIS